ncbi:MAG: TonB-dependent receptor [gamma proteobacterium symbiont of Ctena orbiculata]|nr:MAG: TonB-dependent receptor [gamma proteobacterium symbiont of Ctena orbiculata]
MYPDAAINAQPTVVFSRKALVIALTAALCSPVYAEENTTVLDTIQVTGQAASLDSALDVQQMADNILSVVHADDIGQLPDTNAAEALQRLPGVSIERDQGEGRYVRIRGMAPDFNSVTINGGLVPAPESDVRAVALDVLPSGLISSLEISKTLTPDQDANSIGGTIDVKTISAFDHEGMFYSVEGGGSHDTNIDETSPYGVAAWSNLFADGKLGIAAGISSDNREFGSDNTETGGAWGQSGAEPALEEFERRDYHITRERLGGVFNMDYRPQAGTSYYLRSLLSSYSDEETRQRHNIEFDDPQTEGSLGDTETSRELKSREETHDINSFQFGMDRNMGDWDLGVGAGISKSDQDTPDYISSAEFVSGETYQAGFSNSRKPELIGDAAINSAADYELDAIEMEDQYTEDKEHNLHVDLERYFTFGDLDNELKFGAKISRREKSNELTVWKIDGEDFGNPSMADFVSGGVDYPYGDYGPAISASAVHDFVNGIDRSDYLEEEESRINDFTMNEDIDAAYIQNTFSKDMWRLLAGFRYESTDFTAKGTGVEDGSFRDVKADNNYHDWLPALHLRVDLDNDTTVRAAWTHSVVRPTFEQLAPGFVIDGDEAEFGDPDLKPMKAANFDLGIERRLGFAGVMSAYLFYKEIDDFIYNTDLAGSGMWSDFSAAETFSNGDKAKVHGLELAYSQTFRQLPAPWDGLLFTANATFTDSDATIDGYVDGAFVSRDISLPSQSDLTLNATLGYEKGPLGLRLAINHKSEYLSEVGDIDTKEGDLYVDEQTQYDFSAHYRIGRNMQLVFEALNLSDEEYYVYTNDQGLNAQYESYGRTYRLGIKVASF